MEQVFAWNDSRLDVIMQKSGTTLDVRQFVREVNNAYHGAEVPFYALRHCEIFDSLDKQWERLIGRALSGLERRGAAAFCDFGCGTGFVTEQYIRIMGEPASHHWLVDPSKEMISEAKRKLGRWKSLQFAVGDIDTLVSEGMSFDLFACNSVLHHIVDLDNFLGKLVRVLQPGGYLAICHEPNPIYYHSRISQVLAMLFKTYRRLCHLSNPGWVWRRILRRQARFSPDYLRGEEIVKQANVELISKGVISCPLLSKEMTSIVDFHVPEQGGRGVSMEELGRVEDLYLIDSFTYQFFGVPPVELTWPFSTLEQRWMRHRMRWGRIWGGLWRKHLS